jgi:hypothetical protein
MLRYVRHLHYTVRTVRVAVSTTLLCHWVVLCYVRSLEDKAKSHNTHSNGSSRTGHFRKQYTPSCWPFLCLFSTYMYTWARNYLNATRIKENEFDCIDARGTIAEVGFTTFTLGKNDLHTAQMQSTQVYHLCEVPALKWRRRTLQSLNPLANKFANFDSSKAWKLPKHSRPQMGYLVLCTPKV